MKALTLMRCAVGLAMVLAWSLRVLAVPVISSVQLDPEPFRQGAAFSVRVEGTDLAAGTGFLDLRPTVTRVIRFTFVQDNGAWVGAGSVPADLGLQGETTATLNLTFTGSTGQRTLRTLNVRIVADGDTTPPEVAISEPPEGAIFAASPIEVTGTASADATEVTVNGVLATLAGDGTWSATVPLTEGSNTLTASAKDAAGNVGTDSVDVLLDTVAPTLTLVNPPDGGVADSRTPNIQIGYTDDGSGIDVSSVRLVLNGVDVTGGSSIDESGASYTPGSPLPTGDNQVMAEVKDRAGNTQTASFRFTVAVFRAIADCAPTSGPAPLTVTFRTRGEFTGGSIVRYRWDFENDGVWDTTDSVARDLTHTYSRVGVYEAVLEVQNNFGEVATDVCVITVTGSPPVAHVELIPSNGAVPLPVRFEGYGLKSGGAIVLVEFDFDGDGNYDLSLDPAQDVLSRPEAIRFKIVHADCGATVPFRFHLNDEEIGSGASVMGCVCNNLEAEYEISDPDILARWAEEGGNTLKVTWGPSLLVAYIRVELVYADRIVPLCLYDYDGTGCVPRNLCSGGYDDIPYEASTAVDVLDELFSFSVEHVYETEGAFNAVVRVTDNEGNTATASATATVVRVGPPGSPTVFAMASVASGFAPLQVNFSGTATDDGTIVLWEWDFDGDGDFDFSSPTSATASHTFTEAGHFAPALRVTDNDGLTSVDTVELNVDMTASLSITGSDTFNPSEGQQVTIRTTISAATDVRLILRNRQGVTVRELVNGRREAGTYEDTWDGTDNQGLPLAHGPYYAILQYRVGAELREIDLTASTGGQQYNPQRNSLPGRFQPFEDNHLTITFTVPQSQGASEIQAFIGLFNTDTRFITLLEREPFGVGSYTITWDGLDPDGNFAVPPPGDSFLFGIWGFRLPDNAVFLVAAPTLSDVTVEPNFFDPSATTASGENRAVVQFTLDKSASVELTVTRLDNGRLLRRIRRDNVSAGTVEIEWDGRADNGILVDRGDYRLALRATDAAGSQSLVRYALVRVFY